MRRFKINDWAGIGLGLLLPLAACDEPVTSSKEGDAPGADGGDGGDGGGGPCEEDADCEPLAEICEDGACVDGDRNNAPEEAAALRFAASSDDASARVEGVINPAGDVDWLEIQADGGEFIKITTYTDEEDEAEDTVVTVMKANGKVLTLANGYAAGSEIGDADAIAYAYLSEPGSYYVKVEDNGSYDADAFGPPDGSPSYRYEVLLLPWAGVDEPDSAESPGEGILISAVNSWSARGVLLESPGDVDYVLVQLDADEAGIVVDGNLNIEGSDARPRARLLDRSGRVLADAPDLGLFGLGWAPDVPPGEYLIELSDVDGGGGPDHWFFVHTIGREASTSYSEETEDNGPDGTPDALDQEPLETSNGNAYSVARVEGAVDGPGDVDRFSFASEFADGRIVVCLNSGVYGWSAAPLVRVLDDEGAVVGEVEASLDAFPAAALDNLPGPAGDYTLELVHGDDAVGEPYEMYRALIYVADFDVDAYDCP
jgi:hypothetical protein